MATKTLQVSFCSSKDQLVDVFTKPIVATRFSEFKASLNVVDTPLDSRGCINLNNKNTIVNKCLDDNATSDIQVEAESS